MKKDIANPTIRILVLGSPGVGKNCLESRFTTTTYPPPYDPALTLNSRRYFTLHPHLDIPPASVTRPLATSHGLGPMADAHHHLRSRPRSAGGSSTCSNPASEVRPEAQDSDDPGSLSSAEVGNRRPCVTCLREADTYLVEVINYPALQSAKVRSQVLSKGEYDAVMLVYDVGNRNTFETAMDLHGEIPLGKRWRRASHSNAGDKTRRGFFGGSSGSDKGNVHGGGETVVALVGNKADFDAEYASVELGLDGPLSDKMAVLEEVDVEERSLVHPLFRESRIYDELSFPHSPLSARSPVAHSFHGRGNSRHDASLDVRRSVLSADQILDNRRSVLSLQRSVRTVPPRLDKPPRSFPVRDHEDKLRIVEKWLDIRRPTIDSGRRGSPEEEEPCTRLDSANTESTTVAKRQVSRLEGQMLARTLLLQVPFFETSAKTGENVEEAFTAIVQGVLKEMGLDTTNQIMNGTLQARCERKHGRQGQHGRQEGPQPAQEATAAQPEPKKATAESETAVVEDVEADEGAGNGPAPTQRRVRRESMIHRVKKVFMKKPPVMMADIAAC